MIAGNRSLHDLGFYLKAMKYQKIIKKCVAILKDNYQPEPVQGAQVDHIKKQVYDTAKARGSAWQCGKTKKQDSQEDVEHS